MTWMKLKYIMLTKKKARPKRLHAVQLHLYDILEKAKL